MDVYFKREDYWTKYRNLSQLLPWSPSERADSHKQHNPKKLVSVQLHPAKFDSILTHSYRENAQVKKERIRGGPDVYFQRAEPYGEHNSTFRHGPSVSKRVSFEFSGKFQRFRTKYANYDKDPLEPPRREGSRWRPQPKILLPKATCHVYFDRLGAFGREDVFVKCLPTDGRTYGRTYGRTPDPLHDKNTIPWFYWLGLSHDKNTIPWFYWLHNPPFYEGNSVPWFVLNLQSPISCDGHSPLKCREFSIRLFYEGNTVPWFLSYLSEMSDT